MYVGRFCFGGRIDVDWLLPARCAIGVPAGGIGNERAGLAADCEDFLAGDGGIRSGCVGEGCPRH